MRSPASLHLDLEIAAVFNGTTLSHGDPVPGCGCVRCQVGGPEEDILEAEDMVVVLARLPEDERIPAARAWAEERARCGRELAVPSPGVLSILAAREPGAVRTLSPGRNLDLDRLVRAARSRPVLDVFTRFVGEPVKRGRSWQIRCPFHDDRTPSLSIDPDEGLWFCHACAFGGDGIELVMRLHNLEFVEAVKEVAA